MEAENGETKGQARVGDDSASDGRAWGELTRGPSINDITQNFWVFGPPLPLSTIGADLQYNM